MRRREDGEGPAVALAVLQAGSRRARRDHRRRSPARGGSVRASRGDRLRDLDLLRRPRPAARPPARPRLHRHRLLGGALRRADRRARGRARRLAWASAPRRRGLAERDRLPRLLPLEPSFRDGDVVDAGPGALERVLAGAPSAAAEPEWRSVLDEPVLIRPGDWTGPAARARELHARRAARGGEGREPARPRRRRLPGRAQVGLHAPRTRRREVHRRQRRRGRPRLLHRQVPDGAEPGAPARGHGRRRLRGRRRPRASSTCARSTRARSRRSSGRDRARATPPATSATTSTAAASPSTSHVVEGAGSLRGRRGDGAAQLAPGHARHGLGAAAVPGGEAATTRCPTVVNNVETLCNAPFIARTGRRGLRGAQPRRDAGDEARLPERALRAIPA